ncbi:hypothetical protein FA95DRAFT_985273 [Auriscalpium vulgare]|uniref:Uncharacterized protein n=1 Tax=Auriscalpium vulgare TaxID=40419 RepID=A0ACB8RYH6_9AGAM|nr:hypothetical protein FA95DRAFT_985273 [Auriscalpium vulgare]
MSHAEEVQSDGGGHEVTDTLSADLWFNDGNIVVRSVAEGTPPIRTLYKLHEFILARHCSAFASLFNGPQEAFAAGSEHREGLPVMDLSDSAEDLKHFLKAFYIPEATHIHRPPSLLSTFREALGGFP